MTLDDHEALALAKIELASVGMGVHPPIPKYRVIYQLVATFTDADGSLARATLASDQTREYAEERQATMRYVLAQAVRNAAGAVARENEAFRQHEEEIEGLQAEVELAKAGDSDDTYEGAVRALKAKVKASFEEIARLRHETAVAKIPSLIEHLEDAIEGGKVIFFAHHLDVLHAVKDHFGDQAVLLEGSTSLEERQAAVDAFQNDATKVLFVGSLMAAGVGITLTASAHVVFGELDWVPGNVTQAEDRAHRIGQTSSVLVQHLVLEGSLDSKMAKTLVAKQEVIDRALDCDTTVPVVPRVETTTRKQLDETASKITQEQIQAIHLGLQRLALVCDGALAVDACGFNKMDTTIGKSLAQAPRLTPRQAALGLRLVQKYRRQLPAELLATAKGAA